MFESVKLLVIRNPRAHMLLRRWHSPVFRRVYEPHPSDYFGYDLHADKRAKVGVFGLPKSGNNWLLGLLSEALEIDVVPSHKDDKNGVFIWNPPFSSDLYLNRDIRYGVYIMRDLRDLVCSYYHYLKRPEVAGGRHVAAKFDNIEDFYFEYFLGHLSKLYDVDNHARSFLDFDLPMVRYEKLWDAPEVELRRLFSRWGIPVGDAAIERAVEANRIDKVQAEGRNTRGHKLDKMHARKGGYGGYASELSASVIADIEGRYGDYLRRWGYETSHRS